jgi:tetratricopeptide (TPR) repeat protein
MSTYLGNDALSAAVKERVLTTFQQTLQLYKQGRTDEVFAGIGLILRMDPQFDPAKKLLDKARNPSLPIDVDSLVPSSAGGGDALDEARQALRVRDFQRAVNITTEILTNDLMNDDARVINEQAREKLEAAPFVEQFAKKCEQNIANGNIAQARTDLEKARALDGDHPAIKRVEQLIGGSAPAPAASQGGFGFDSPSFVVETPKSPIPGRGTAQAADFGFTFEEDKQPEAPPAAPSGGFTFDSPAAAAPAPPPQPPPQAATPSFGFSFDSPSSSQPSGGDALSNFSFGAPEPAAPEPPAASFSFDAPAPAAPPPSSSSFSFDAPATAKAPAGEFDFSGASTETSPDDQRRIEGYLGEGDRAFDGGDYQKAIDLWSRIFLIDVTNEQASERIERAKLKRRDAEQKVEGVLAAGIAAFEKGNHDDARTRFNEVLRIDPNNASAQDYIERLNDTVAEGGAGAYEVPFVPPPPTTNDDLFAEELDSDFGGGGRVAPIPEPVAPATAKSKAAAKAAAAKPAPSAAKKSSPMGLIAVLVGAVVLVGGGWFGYTKFVRKPAVDPAATQALFKQVEKLATQGKYDQAIAMLQDVKPDDPMHDKANIMISDLQGKKSQAAEMIDGRPASVYYQENLANGKTAFESHDYEGAKKAFDNAARVRPLTPDMKTMYDAAAQQVAKLDSAKTLFKEARYQDAITNLEPLLQQDPQNRSIQRMILDSHFNLGASALQDERLPDAIKEFDEVLKADPTDELAKRSRELAARYNGQPKDLLYKIYVKYLPLRKVS